MFVLIEYPLLDLRPFFGRRAARLAKPAWSHSAAGSLGFVRNFGAVKVRNDQLGVSRFAAAGGFQELYCDANRAIRFGKSGRADARNPWNEKETFPGTLAPQFRRLYVDDQANIRLEVGIAVAIYHQRRLQLPEALRRAESIVTAVLATDMRVTSSRTDASLRCKLYNLAEPLARRYVAATTPHPRDESASTNASEVSPASAVETGAPVVIVETKQGILPEMAQPLGEWPQNGLSVVHEWLTFPSGHRMSVWWVVCTEQSDLTLRREIRKHLVHFHAARTAMYLFGKAFFEERLPTDPSRSKLSLMKTWITEKGELLFGDPHRSSRQADFFHQVREMDANVNIAETHDLTSKLSGIADYLQLNVNAYLAKAATPRIDKGVNLIANGQEAIPLEKTIFISYSHKEKRWRDDLDTQLKPYLRGGSIVSWSDQQIAPGSEWFKEIQSALANSKVAVLLVSPDFLASDFIHEHELGPLLKEAEQGGVKILWIPVRDSAYNQTPLKNYQAVLDPDTPLARMTKAKRDQAWVKICEEIRKAVNPQ